VAEWEEAQDQGGGGEWARGAGACSWWLGDERGLVVLVGWLVGVGVGCMLAAAARISERSGQGIMKDQHCSSCSVRKLLLFCS